MKILLNVPTLITTSDNSGKQFKTFHVLFRRGNYSVLLKKTAGKFHMSNISIIITYVWGSGDVALISYLHVPFSITSLHFANDKKKKKKPYLPIFIIIFCRRFNVEHKRHIRGPVSKKFCNKWRQPLIG